MHKSTLRNRTKITTKVKYLGAGTLVPFYGTKVPAPSIYFLVLLNNKQKENRWQQQVQDIF
ncbi:MAG: hypothetical protein DRG30_03480 [Epsilonproteobacteria bacterium]|nr:MAG: hypothetical protein DRG30_03480 [Campylobacterota bacterium]